MKIGVTIGLCVRNSEATVKQTVDSIINQDFPHEAMEIVVVDGRSKDRTLSIISDSLWASDIQVRMYSDQGKGLGVARQIVVDSASNGYIVWVDGDVVLPKNYVRRQAEFMDRNPTVGAAQGKWGIPQTRGSVALTLENLSELEDQHEGNDIRVIGTTRGAVYRLEAIRQAGGFDKYMKGASEDKDLSHRIRKAGWLLARSHVELYHRFRETWRDLWKEYWWWGYGDHYLNHKHRDLVILWQTVPIVRALSGVRRAFIAYKLTHIKLSFLLPFQHFFKMSAYWFGFLNSHMDGYGHKNGAHAL